MKDSLKILLILISINCFSQNICFEGKILPDYSTSKTFILTEVSHDQTITFEKDHKLSRIIFYKKDTTFLVLKNRKWLVTNKGDTLSYLKNRKIYLTGKKNVLKQKKIKKEGNKKGWKYTENDITFCEVYYEYNKQNKKYNVSIFTESKKIDNKTLSAISIGLGRLDYKVYMEKDERPFLLDLIPAVIGGIVGGVLVNKLTGN